MFNDFQNKEKLITWAVFERGEGMKVFPPKALRRGLEEVDFRGGTRFIVYILKGEESGKEERGVEEVPGKGKLPIRWKIGL